MMRLKKLKMAAVQYKDQRIGFLAIQYMVQVDPSEEVKMAAVQNQGRYS